MNNKEYEEMKKIFNQKSANETTYEAQKIMNLDEEYQRTGIYNGQDIRGEAIKTHNEMMAARGYEKGEDGNYNFISFEGRKEVKRKAISKEDKTQKIKKTVIASLVALGLAGGTIAFVDVANHPENYLTTDPNFQGAATISQVIERTPQNFGIGGK